MMDEPGRRSSTTTMRNFLRMTVFFSINHACVVTVLSLAVGLLGKSAGSVQSGTLYVTYAATALFFSSGVVQWLGPRRALVVATCLYSLYVVSFPLALIAPGPQSSVNTSAPSAAPTLSPTSSISNSSAIAVYCTNSTDSSGPQIAVAVVGGLIGGVGGGFIWAAQGVYFSLSAKLYAAERGVTLEKATMTLASIFAAVYLAFEVATKLLPLALLPLSSDASSNISLGDGRCLKRKDLIVVVTYAVMAILAVFGMFSIKDLRDVKPAEQAEQLVKSKPEAPAADDIKQSLLPAATVTPPRRPRADFSRVLAAVALWRDDPLILLLNPIQMTFGLCAGMLATNVTGAVLQPKFGPDDWVSFGAMFVSLPALVAALLQYPFKLMADRVGKLPLMMTGLLGFVAVSGVVYFLTEDCNAKVPTCSATLKTWGVLVPIYLLQGLGRACYEGTNKALIADFFTTKAAAAFSNIVIANGFSSALLFFMNSGVSSPKTIPLLTLCSAVPTVGLYLTAELIRRRRIHQAQTQDA
jgi:hypothetical protein